MLVNSTRVESFALASFVSIKPISLSPFALSPFSRLFSSPGLLATERHLPRPPRDVEEEEIKGSAPLAKDDTDETRRRGAAAAAVVGVGAALANALSPLVLAWPPRATPPLLRAAQVVAVAFARIGRIDKRVKKGC